MKIILNKPYILKRRIPENFSETDRKHFAADFQVDILENHVKNFKNSTVLQLFLFYRWKLQKKYCFTRKVPPKKEIKAYFKCLFFPKIRINEGLWIIDQWSIGYYHWFVEALPRIISAEEVSCFFPILFPKNFTSIDYITESLKIFNRDLVTYNLNEKVIVKNLVSPSHLQPAQCDQSQIKKVRERFRRYDEQFYSVNPVKKVYISRTKAKRRFIVNEIKLNEFLVENGFIIVFMENLSFFEQRKLMAETSILLSNHGAGLTNMLFMKENSIVIELKSDSDDINNCFFNLARALNHKYFYTINSASDKRVQYANINVDMEALKLVLSEC